MSVSCSIFAVFLGIRRNLHEAFVFMLCVIRLLLALMGCNGGGKLVVNAPLHNGISCFDNLKFVSGKYEMNAAYIGVKGKDGIKSDATDLRRQNRQRKGHLQ